MVGLQMQSNEDVLQRWHHLFESRGEERSMQAQQHWQQLLCMGLPTRKQENWKYTSLDSLFAHNFVLPANRAVSQQQLTQLALKTDAVRLVFIDGKFCAQLSDRQFDLFEVQIIPSAGQRDFETAIQPEVFLHLTESLAEDTSWVRLSQGKVAPRPLYLLHISSGSKNGELNTSHYRHHLHLAEGAQAQVIEHYVSLSEAVHFTGSRLTMALENNAHLQHCKLAFENKGSFHFAHNDVRLQRDCVANSQTFLLGAGLSRHNTSAELNGENSDIIINSLALPVEHEIADTRSYLKHNKGYCQSRQLHKTIVRDRGRAVFNGVVNVAKQALKTDGKMTNNNLLLGRLAEVDTKPQLEIYADDVKCSHGATIGRIDDEQIFYLRSRGIDEVSAQRMIIFAFAAELTEAITDDTLKEAVLKRISSRFPGGDNGF